MMIKQLPVDFCDVAGVRVWLGRCFPTFSTRDRSNLRLLALASSKLGLFKFKSGKGADKKNDDAKAAQVRK